MSNTRRYVEGTHLFVRDGRFYVYLSPESPHAVPERRSLGTTDRREAERKLGEILAGRRDPRDPQARARDASLATIVTRYLTAPHGWTERTRRTCEVRLLAWLSWCEAQALELPGQISGDHSRAWLESRLGAKIKHSTVDAREN